MAPPGTPRAQLDSNLSQSVAVDPSSDDVYVDEGSQARRASTPPANGSDTARLRTPHWLQSASRSTPKATSTPPTPPAPKSLSSPPPWPQTALIDNPLVVDASAQNPKPATPPTSRSPPRRRRRLPLDPRPRRHEEQTAGQHRDLPLRRPLRRTRLRLLQPDRRTLDRRCRLAADGLSLTDDGRVFFTTPDPLVAADTDEKQDVYEWEPQGRPATAKDPVPPSTRQRAPASPSSPPAPRTFDSGLLGADASGTDVYFFTRDSLVPQDKNGPTMKIYDAREGGGFPYTPPRVECKASDECHGAASARPPPTRSQQRSRHPQQLRSRTKKAARRATSTSTASASKSPKAQAPQASHHKRGAKK